jgi:glyoxylase-like metal-dependent hydrolase (beta-lactamase superfamily II)
MDGFIEVAQGVFYLPPPIPEFGGGVTLIKGQSNILIDCGAFDYSVTKFIVPALKEIKVDVKSIGYLIFTHCTADSIGGVHKLKQLNPDIKIYNFGTHQANRLKNPSHFFMEKWSSFLDHSPPFRELRGILPNGPVDVNSRAFADLEPFNAQGHDLDCVCWYHKPTGTLICGDAIQGDGTENTGIAFITSLSVYKSTLNMLSDNDEKSDMVIKNMVCSRDFKLCPAITKGKENCTKVLDDSIAQIEKYAYFVDKYAKLNRKKKENIDLEELVRAYFEDKEQPSCYGYAMRTFSEFTTKKS